MQINNLPAQQPNHHGRAYVDVFLNPSWFLQLLCKTAHQTVFSFQPWEHSEKKNIIYFSIIEKLLRIFIFLKIKLYNIRSVLTIIILHKLTMVEFIYSEKSTKFCEISSLLLSTVHTDKSKVEILQILWPSQKLRTFQ